jgi:UPF0755 protein
LTFGALAAAVWMVWRSLDQPLPIADAGYNLVVEPGASWTQVAQQLEADGLVTSSGPVIVWGRITGLAGRVQAGEYDVRPGSTPRTLLELLVAGRVRQERVTLVEGRTVRELLAVLKEAPRLKRTLRSSDPESLARELGLQVASAEGQFLPETYLYPAGFTDRELLLQAHRALSQALEVAWRGRQPDLPLSNPQQLLTLASIIERETALAAERPAIAGVFVRRLRLGMRLQTDPTVIYGIGPDFNGNLTRRDLDTDTPWNTYTRTGLPATPIAIPSRAALDAAANPAPGTALFFVASGAGDGSHRFSDTLAEHEAAVRAYLAALRDGS